MLSRCDRPTVLGLLLAAGVLAAQVPGDVTLPEKEYRKLLDEVEQARKAKAAKPQSPSRCQIACTLKRSAERPVAALTIAYQFRTSLPNSLILLGAQKAFAVGASLDGGGPAALESTPDGLVATIESAGEHTLTLNVETAIAARGAKGEVGFEVGLPRAAITTLALASPGPELKAVTLGTRWAEGGLKAGELKSTTLDPAKLVKDYPLGPTDVLEITWESPKAAAPPGEPNLEIEIAVHVEEARVETKATLTLRGPPREWKLALPAGAELTSTATPAPKIARPADAKSTEWTVTPAAGQSELVLTATLAQPREAKALPVGPFLARGGVRQSGTIKIYAPITLRVAPLPAADVRRIEAPFSLTDHPAAMFRYAMLPGSDRAPAPFLEFDVRPATGFVAAQPRHKLTLTAAGWKLRSEYRIAPVRTALTQLVVDLPAGWQDPTFAPLELLEEVIGGGASDRPRTLTVRFANPQREAFELILEARWPLSSDAREAALLLPRIPAARERDVQIAVAAPDSLELTGSVREWDGSKPSPAGLDLPRSKPHLLAGAVDRAPARIDLAWQPVRANYSADLRAEVTFGERQLLIHETLLLGFPEGTAKAVRLLGPAGVAGLRAVPAVESQGLGEWSFQPPPGAKEATLTLTYAVPLTAGDARAVAVPLIWADTAAAQTHVRVWPAGTSRCVAGFQGAWREAPPEPSPIHDSLPVLTLAASGSSIPLTLNLAECDRVGQTIVDRAVCQWWLGESGAVQGRIRYRFLRWPGHLDVDLHGGSLLAVSVDKLRVEPTPLGNDRVQVALPEARAGRTGLTLELRFTGPAATPWSPSRFHPPELPDAAYRQGVWWQFAPPADVQPLLFGRGFAPEFGWRWRAPGWTPAAAMSEDELERWLQDGQEAGGLGSMDGDAATGRQTRPAAVTVVLVPRLAGLILGAGAVLGLGLAVVRSSGRLRMAILFALAALAAAAAILIPQPLAQAALAVQAGLAALLILLIGLAVIRRQGPPTPFTRGAAPSAPEPSRSRLENAVPTQATP